MAKFIIDAGHGLHTLGKRSHDGSLREFQFNKPVADLVKKGLLEYVGTEVIFAHDPDGSTDVSLDARTDLAKKHKDALAFVSIHANAGVSSASGIETFHHDTKASAVSKALAKVVQANLIQETGLKNRGVKSDNFHVLRETPMPAILVECGFMTHAGDLAKLKSTAHRQACADAIVRGLVTQFKLKKKPAPKPVAPKPVAPAKDVPGKDGFIHAVAVDGVQVGAFGMASNVADAVEKAVLKGAKKIVIARV